MKRLFFYSLIMAMLPVSSFAQDDMYFVPKKSDKKVTTVTPPRGTTPARPLEMSVDEYNRRTLKSSVEVIGNDSVGNDIIDFSQGDGTYPATDTIYVRVYDDDLDYRYSARMGLFDDFYGWYDPWYYDWMGFHYGHYWGRYWGPYWYSSYYPWYTPWAYGFYDPYYYWGWGAYSWYGYYGMGWGYNPYWNYYGPYWGIGTSGSYAHRDVTGTHNHGYVARNYNGISRSAHHGTYTTASRGTFGGSAISRGSSTASTSGRSSVSRGGITRTTSSRGVFGGSRSYSSSSSSSSGSSRSYSAPSYSSSSSSSGSFGGGGSRSGGSFGGGGSRSGGSYSGGGGGRLGGGRR